MPVNGVAATPFAANNFLKAIRKLFDWAKDAEYISKNPADDVDFLRDKKRRAHALDHETMLENTKRIGTGGPAKGFGCMFHFSRASD